MGTANQENLLLTGEFISLHCRMKFWLVLLVPLVTSCIVPLGYTAARAQGFVSDTPSAQYLQLSIEYWKKGQDAKDAAGADNAALADNLKTLSAEFAQRVDFVTQKASADAEIATGDDTGILRRSLAGVALSEVLASTAQGRSAAEVSDVQQTEFQKVIQSVTAARGLFLANQSIWPGNTVYYRWASGSNPSPAHREALTAAMNEWSQRTSGRVKFDQLEASIWNNFQLTVGVLGCVILQDAALESRITGRATVGYQIGSVFGYLKLQPDLAGDVALRRASLHELGHVLGLLHEHKRPDRDAWIDVASGGYSGRESDLSMVDEFTQNFRWQSFQVSVGPWTATLYYPVWWRDRNARLVGPFDLKSVMIYSGFLTKQDWKDPGDGTILPAGSPVPWNTDLSPTDVDAVNALYP